MCLNESRRHYVDDLTAQCLREIATLEGCGLAAPQAGEWLSKWRTRASSRPEYLELADYLKNRFQIHYAELRQRKEEAERQAKERRCEQYKEWLLQYRTVVDRFLKIADRKVSQLDDYGDERWDVLPKEIQTCLLKLAKTENDDGATEENIRDAIKEGHDGVFWEYSVPEKYQWLRMHLESEFRSFHRQRSLNAAKPGFEEMSGVGFETFLASLLKRHGFENIRGTPATGDQGADLLATKANRAIAIQAKRYRGAVGNKAVQEVVSAVRFYGVDEGWVITSGTFTSSAKALAQANGVRLIDGYDLRNDFRG
jgi:hypothetical protein